MASSSCSNATCKSVMRSSLLEQEGAGHAHALLLNRPGSWYRKERRAATPVGAAPRLVLILCDHRARRVSSGLRGLFPIVGLPLRWRMSRGPYGPADLAVPTALLTLLSKSSCLSTGYRNSRLIDPAIQVGKDILYGDGADEPAYGTSRRPSHASVTIPSTIGGITPGCDAPPMLICVPFAGARPLGGVSLSG
jgi:hypothetical protein